MSTGYADLLARFGAAPASPLPPAPVPATKQTEVSTASAQKKAALGGSMPSADEMYNLSAARANGSGSSVTNPLRRDILSNNIWQNFQKYGAAAGDIAGNRAIADTTFREDQNATRSTFEAIQDFGDSVAGGAVSSIMGIGALGLGLVNDRAGGWAAEKTGQLNQFVQDNQSAGLQARRRAYNAVNQASMADNTAQFEKDKKTDGTFVASLKRFGRDAYDAVANATGDSAILSDGIANGVGSLAVGAPLAKGLAKIGSAALKGATTVVPSLLFSERAAKIASLGSKSAMPASIGLMEGGGTYQQTYEQAIASLADRTDLTDDQKASLANKAALEAAAIQTPVAAATGIITSKFEASPFKVANLRSAAGNAIKEAVEEGLQSGTSQLATNMGLRDQINPNQELSEGLGEQVGLGALYGMGTAGAVQTPGAALRAVNKTAGLAVGAAAAGVRKVVDTVEGRFKAVTGEIAAQSPVSAVQMDQVYATAIETAPAIQAETIKAVNEATDVTPEQKAATLDYVDQFFNDVKFDPQELTSLPAPMLEVLGESTDRFDAIKRAADAAVNPELDAETRLMSALYLEGAVAKYAPGLQDTIERIPDEHPALDQLREFENVMLNLGQDPRIAQAVQVARNFADSFNADTVSDANISTPQGQQAAQTVASATSMDPMRVDPAIVDTVLKHATQGKVQLTNDQRAFLQAASDLNRVEQEYQEKGGKLNLSNGEIVTRQIRTDKGNANSTGLSAAEHLSGVFAAVRARKLDIARERMDELTNFAQSLQNKLIALNESLATGKGQPVTYEAYNPNTRKFFKASSVFLNGLSENSVQTAQNIALDAKAVADVHSSLARAFPELGFASIEQTQLNADFLNNSADVAVRAYKQRIQQANNERRAASTAERLAQDPRSATRTEGRSDNADRQSKAPDSTDTLEKSQDRQPDPVRTVAESVPVEGSLPADEQEVSQSQPEAPAQPASEAEVSAQEARVEQETVTPEQSPVVAETVDERSDDENASTPVSSMDVAYPNLLGSGDGRGRNLFKQAFTLPAEAISRLTGEENPLQTVRDALSSGTKFRALVGQNAGDTKLTDNVAEVYAKLLKYTDKISQALDTQLADSLKKNAAFIEKRSDWFAQKEYRAAAITDNVDGNIKYNQELKEAAILAGLQWFIQADQRQRPMDEADVQKIIGFEPTNDQVELFNQGLYYNGAVVDMTDMILRYWGVRTNPNTGRGIVRGVPEAVAKEMLRAMAEVGLIKNLDETSFKIDKKKYRQIVFNTNDIFDDVERRSLMSNPSMIEMASLVEPEQIMFVGAPPTTTPKTQLRNPEVKLTAQQTQMVEKEQKTPFYVVPHMLDFLRGIGPDGAVALFGHGDVDSRVMNEKHKTALTSVNRTVYAAFESIDAIAALAEQKASDAKVDMTDMPIYYAYEFTSVNRLQMLGKHNPQANKLTREVIMPTRSTVNMTDALDNSRFWLAVGQAWGDKVHKKQRAEVVKNAQALALGSYAPAINMLQDWLKQGGDITEEQITELRKVFDPSGKKPVAPVAFYAAMEIARLRNATPDEQRTFNTSLYVEADGITDGPMNAMIHMAGGFFTENWINILRKGGLYFDKRGATSNDQGNIADLYQVTANAFKDALARLEAEVSENGPVRDSLASLMRLSGSLLGDLSYDPETNTLLSVERGAVKNPLTVVIYGAGDAGIANKISTTLVKAIYERMSDQLQFVGDNPNAKRSDMANFLFPGLTQEEADKRYAQYDEDVARLMGSRVERMDGKLTFVDGKLSGKDISSAKKSNTEFEFTAAQMKNMQDNILTLFVAPLQEGIQANIGETVTGTNMVRMATQIQSIYLQHAYQRAVQEALDTREKLAKTDGSGWVRSDFLSERELRSVQDKMKYLAPFIGTGTQNMLISGSERAPVMGATDSKAPIEFSRSLDGDGSTSAYMTGYTNAGVSGIPKTTISTGDGQMMQNFSVNPDVGDGYMLIFDGANFRLSDVEGYSEKINKAVYDGWLANPFADVSRTFEDFIRVVDLDQINNEEMLSDLTFALTKKRSGLTAKQIPDLVKQLQTNMAEYAQTVQARKAVLSKVQMSVDHMASAGSPFVSSEDLVSLEGLTNEQAATRLNELMVAEKAKLLPVEPVTMDNANLRDLIRATKLTGDAKALFSEAVIRAQKLGYSITTDADVSQFSGENVAGYIRPSEKMIYLAQNSEETLLHEIIHAATFDQVYAYYTDQSSLSPEQIDAVQRIEELMNEWLINTDAFNGLNIETRQAADNARTAIMSGMVENTSVGKAKAVNEFMAWVLANQNLSQVASVTKTSNPIIRIAKEVLSALKQLFGFKTKVGDDILSNLRFNTRILMSGTKNSATVLADTVLFQSGNFGTSDRLTQLSQEFSDKVSRKLYAIKEPATKLTETLKAAQATLLADKITTAVIANGFSMDMQSKSAFQMMLAAFTADVQLDPNAFGRAQELFNHVSKNIKVEDFMADPTSQDPNERYIAQSKYDTLVGSRAVETDEQGRSTLVPTFMALATVDENLRNILGRMDLPKNDLLPNESVDNIATNLATQAMDRLSVAMAGERQNSASVQETLDALMDKIGSITEDRAAFIDQAAAPVGSAIDAANTWFINTMSAMSKETVIRADKLKQSTKSKALSTAADFAKLLAGVVDKDVAGALSQSAMSQINKSDIWQPVADLMNELVGRTEENANVYDMIKQVRSVIQSFRQQYREHLPELIQKQFSRELTDAEQTAMFNGLAKTDIASLRSGYSISQINKLLLDPSKSIAEAKKLEKGIPVSTILKARQLAEFMNTGRASNGLLRNAYAIANNFGSNSGSVNASSSLVNTIDHLVSLYALEGLNQTDRSALASLVQDEAEGMNFVVSYLEGQRKDELLGAANDPKIQANLYKGYVPSEQQGGIGLIVADDMDYVELRQRGYERVADYEGADAEYAKGRKGYYFSPISGKSVYSQGILQTVHTTVSGINAATGFTSGTMTAGRITDPKTVDRITKLMSRKTGGKEQLLPVFDGTGKVVAYERSVDPNEIQRLNRSTHLSKMLGAWRGRQAEEAMAGKYNEALIDNLYDMWNIPDQVARKAEFVNVLDKSVLAKDPVLADAVRLIPYDSLDYIGEKFGNGFWVRKDMLNDALGYRQASVGDAWTGTTRWSPEVQKGIQQVATSVFGADAYKRMIQAEKFIQNRVTDARVMIVVKSIIVPMSNLIANMYQLSARGVPIAQTIRSMPKKTAEINGYVKGRLRKIELEGLLRASINDVVAQRKYSAEIRTIEDSWTRLSIWPLIEAGEFTSVSDVGLGKEDIDITEGRLSAYIEKLVDKMPEGIQTAAKYAIVSKDTALFKGLQKTVEYGDFLAKAVLYDDLISRQKKTKEQALGEVTEEFVNYDRLPGRARSYLENMGLLWFWNFKVRSAKVAVSMIRNNPVHAFLSMMAPAPPFIGSVGNPITDNILAVAADGRLDNSMGPGQGFRSMELIPWLNLTS